MSKLLSGLLCVYNEPLFTRACISSVLPYLDELIIVEGAWHGDTGSFSYADNFRSDDGTRELVESLAREHGDKITLLNSMGDENITLNYGLLACEGDFVLHLGSDEFYYEEDLKKLREEILPSLPEDIDALFFLNKTFYFNFRLYMEGNKCLRLFRNKDIRFTYGTSVGDVLKRTDGKDMNFLCTDIRNLHFQWVGDRKKVEKNSMIEREKRYQRELMGEDPEEILHVGGWRWWHKEIMQKFDGTNLKELERKAKGSVHPWSYLHEDCRNSKLIEVGDEFKFPSYLYSEEWFQPEEKGRVFFHRYSEKEL